MQTINKVITDLIDKGHRTKDLAIRLDVSDALISTWKNKENDFVPRLPVAARIYKEYKRVVYPYAEEALKSLV